MPKHSVLRVGNGIHPREAAGATGAGRYRRWALRALPALRTSPALRDSGTWSAALPGGIDLSAIKIWRTNNATAGAAQSSAALAETLPLRRGEPQGDGPAAREISGY